MYILQILLVIAAVYLAPALAVAPRLAFDARTALAIPFVSVLLVFLASSVLMMLGVYAPVLVRILSAAAIVAAAVRVARLRRAAPQNDGWGADDRGALAVALALGCYVLLRLIEGGFDENDEIYSWNLWAIQHFLGEPVDFSYTQSPYPQLFPKILSYAYMLLGTIEAQTAVKTALVIFPASIFFAIGLAARGGGDQRFLIGQAILGLILIKGARLDSIFDNGMPDSLMTAGVAASMLFVFLYQERSTARHWLWLAAACAAVAALAKQPALVWALVGLPALLAAGAVRSRTPWSGLWIGFLPAAASIVWMLTEGRDFQENEGVLTRSQADRGPAEQLLHAMNEWFVGEPVILILFAFAVFAAWRSGRARAAIAVFVLPSLAAWFLFASYDIRAGAPAVAAMAVIIAYGRYGLTLKPALPPAAPDPRKTRIGPVKSGRALIGALFAITIGAGGWELAKYARQHDGYRIGFTSLSNLYDMFGANADMIYREIRQADVTLWTPSNYVYGLFYGYTDVIRPNYGAEPYSVDQLLGEIRAKRPDYLTNAGNVPVGRGGKVLEELAERRCPDLFERIAGPDPKYRIVVYRLNMARLDRCAPGAKAG